MIPELRTERLRLRAWRQSDLEPYAEMYADPEVMRYLGPPLDRAGTWRSMAIHAGHWALRGYGNWALERRVDGVFVGRAGLWRPEGWPGLEVGWTLGRGHWGRGYATESGRAAMTWAWEALEADEILSVIHPENVRSQRVAERLGMAAERRWVLDDQELVIYRRERPKG